MTENVSSLRSVKVATPPCAAKLTRQEKKQIDALIRQSKGDGKPHTAQDSIPFERMYKDGICRLANGRYSKCIEFEDINYQLAQPDDKTAIFEP